MRWLFTRSIVPALAALCACAVAGIHADESEVFDVRVHLEVDRSIRSRLIKDVLEDETAAIWQPYGVHLVWTDAHEPGNQEHAFSLEVIVARGIDDPKVLDSGKVLGRAFVEFDTPTRRPIRVSFDATESLLALRSANRSARFVGNRDLARALGRVLAHEIGHVLLGAPYHERTGLMRAVFLPDELADPDRLPFHLACNGVARLRNRLRMLTDDPRFDRLDRTPCKISHVVP